MGTEIYWKIIYLLNLSFIGGNFLSIFRNIQIFYHKATFYNFFLLQEMAAHLANTVLFFVTGIVISERGSRDLTAVDVYYLILFYFALNFIRFVD